MIRVCAWCSQSLDNPGEIVAVESSDQEVTHGICTDCAVEFMDDQQQNLEEYLDSLSVPLMTVNLEGQVVYINSRACRDFNLTPIESRPQLGGDVMQCSSARLPGGCGHTVHCLACALRHTVEETFRTGIPHMNVPASLDHQSVSGFRRVDYMISTYCAGNHVVLRIHDAKPVGTETLIPSKIAG